MNDAYCRTKRRRPTARHKNACLLSFCDGICIGARAETLSVGASQPLYISSETTGHFYYMLGIFQKSVAFHPIILPANLGCTIDRMIFVNNITQPKGNMKSVLNCHKGARMHYCS